MDFKYKVYLTNGDRLIVRLDEDLGVVLREQVFDADLLHMNEAPNKDETINIVSAHVVAYVPITR